MNPRHLAAAVAAVGSALVGTSMVDAAAAPTVDMVEVATATMPVDLTWRVDDDALYVVEQGGRVLRLAEDGTTEPVLDVSDMVSKAGEQGLLGLAFSPDGTKAYVNYTETEWDTVIAEYPVDAQGVFDTAARREVLRIDQPYENHNGGHLAFGPDGYLYIGTGDGGNGGDPERRATNPAELLGKMLRIDPAAADGQPYTVPADNPFVGDGGTAPEIWSLGLRNPWRFSFDRETGDLWIADVGQGNVEEVDVAAATDGVGAGRGVHFGWSAYEGDDRFNTDVEVADHVGPVYSYGHDEGCSVSGGVRPRGEAAGSLEGWYVFSDYCASIVWALPVTDGPTGPQVGERVVVAEPIFRVTAVVDGPDGEVYVLSHEGPIYRLDA